MISILRNILRKHYNLTEGQEIHKSQYKEITSGEIIIEGKKYRARTKTCQDVSYCPPHSELCTAEEGSREHDKPKGGLYLAQECTSRGLSFLLLFAFGEPKTAFPELVSVYQGERL